MGKRKNKSETTAPTVNAVQNRDIMQRMNFLWQASVYLEGISGSSSSCPSQVAGEDEVVVRGEEEEEKMRKEGRRRRRERRGRRIVDGSDLARVYVQTMESVGKRTTTKMDPGVKRTMCKGCSAILVPGVTARVRVRSSSSFGHCISYTCLECSTTRRVPAPRNTEPSITEPSIATTETRAEDIPDVHISHPEVESASTRPPEHEVSLEEKKVMKKGKKKRVVVRQQPLFARRSEGHVVFRGGEVVDMEGVYCV